MTKTTASTENSADSLAVRAAIRRQRLAARVVLSGDAELHTQYSARLSETLRAWFSPRTPASVGFCAPIRGEYDCRPLVTYLISQGWTASIAVSEQAATPLMFREWAPQAAMAIGRHGIPVPQTGFVGAPEVLLIPLVAYDKHGYRLGYGGGYFDRTLAQLASSQAKPIAIGVGFSLAEVDSVLPHRHDQPMDFIVTENGVQATA